MSRCPMSSALALLPAVVGLSGGLAAPAACYRAILPTFEDTANYGQYTYYHSATSNVIYLKVP
jgi:hypothetical protein